MVNALFNKVLGESEKCVFHLKTKESFWPTEYFLNLVLTILCPGVSDGKESICTVGDLGCDLAMWVPMVGTIPWRRESLLTPALRISLTV